MTLLHNIRHTGTLDYSYSYYYAWQKHLEILTKTGQTLLVKIKICPNTRHEITELNMNKEMHCAKPELATFPVNWRERLRSWLATAKEQITMLRTSMGPCTL